MDYSLAAVKVMCGQLRKAKETTSQNAFTLGGVLFQRAWLQGVLVSDDTQGGPFLLDDGTAVIHLSLSGDFLHRNWKTGTTTTLLLSSSSSSSLKRSNLNLICAGMYIMVVGGYFVRTGEPPVIKVNNQPPLLPPTCFFFFPLLISWIPTDLSN